MADSGLSNQGSRFFELRNDIRVGIEDKLSGEELDGFEEFSPVVHRVVDIEAELEPQFVVLLAVTGSRMDTAGARLQGDVLAREDHGVPLVKGVPAELHREEVGLERGDHRTA